MAFTNRPRAHPSLRRRLPRCVLKGKECHASRGAALAHLRALARRFGEQDRGLVPYLCPHHATETWHLGNTRAP